MKKTIYVVLTVVLMFVSFVVTPTFKSEKTPLFSQEETLCEVTVLYKPANTNVSWIKSGIPTHFVRNVFTTETGKKYHSKKSCSGLSQAKAIYEEALDKALDSGLTPCSKCY